MSRGRSTGFRGASDKQTLGSGTLYSDDSPGLEAETGDSGSSNANESVHRQSSAFGGSHETPGAILETTSQTVPHRAWEEGYQSPFSQTFMDPVNNNTPSRRFERHPEPPSTSSSSNAHPQPMQQPLPSLPSASTLATSNTPDTPQVSESMPPGQQYRQRMRRVITQEIAPDDIDISAFVTLGISPFMTGQDIIANQNRFVRNESTFARHFARLQRAITDSEARHAKTEQDIYKHLEQHMVAFEKLAGASGRATPIMSNASRHNVRADPDFLALEKAHQETCARLEELSRQVAESSESIQRALIDLSQRLDQIITQSREPI